MSIQEELHSGTLRQARALALIMKSLTLSLIFWAFTSCRTGNSFEKKSDRKQYFSIYTSILRKAYIIEFPPKLQHLVHVDIYRKVIVRDGLLGLHQPLSNHLQERKIKLKFWSPSHICQETAAFTRKKMKQTSRNKTNTHLVSPCGCC